jgi:hypothetical protein
MWQFLQNILEQGGMVALLFTVAILASIGIIRTLWLANQNLHKELASLQEKRRIEAENYAIRLDTLQEKRVMEAQRVTEEIVRHIEHTRTSMDKVSTAMDVLIDMSRHDRR